MRIWWFAYHLALGLVTFVITRTAAVFPDVQGFDIYGGEHLDDTIMPTEGETSFVHAILVIYENECVGLLKKYKIRPHLLPMTKYVHLLWHDYQTSNSRTWYDYNGADLRVRYKANNCLDVLFIPKGSKAGPLTLKRWNPDSADSFSDWVWSLIVVPVTLTNDLSVPVDIAFIQTGSSSGPMTYPTFTIHPGETEVVDMYESTIVRATTKVLDPKTRDIADQLTGVWIINGTVEINIARDVPIRNFLTVFEDIQANTKLEDFNALETAWNVMQRHLLNLKQPLVVPQFTDTGYKKIKMPEEWFSVLRDFYKANTKGRKNEPWTFGESIINQNEIQCSMVWLSEEVKDTVAEGLRSLMEEWCGFELEMTAFYGVREYFGGNVLRNHVDRLETHVISAIIQIDKDLGGQEDWLLEVIEYGGNRSTIALEPGEMLLYESARLIHGRPKAFKGNLYANVFLHYRPTKGWEDLYIHDKPNFKLYFPDKQSENLMPLNSALTTKYGRKRQVVDVLKSSAKPKDEL